MQKPQVLRILSGALIALSVTLFLTVPAAAKAVFPGNATSGMLSAPGDYPEAVDNSLNPAFPPIGDQGYLASCVAWATTYYQFTYETNHSRGISSDSSQTIFSPRWTYNFINKGGGRNITHLSDAYTLLTRNGAVTLADFPYTGTEDPPENYLAWCLDAEAWQRAINYRAAGWGMINHSADSDLEGFIDALKSQLAAGHVLVFVTFVNSWVPQMISSGPAEGELIAAYMNDSENDLHSMTLVGYDDRIWCDLNGNGEAEEGEFGAFKAANSQGTDDWNNGFRWVSYDALRMESRVPATDSWTPEGRDSRGIFLKSVYTLSVQPDYQPELIAEVTLSHSLRNQVAIYLGAGETGEEQPAGTPWVSGALCYDHSGQGQGGPFAFDGTTSGVSGTFYFDMTDTAGTASEGQRYFIGIEDNNPDGHAASVSSIRIFQAGEEGLKLIAESESPLEVDGSLQYVWVDYTAPVERYGLNVTTVGRGTVVKEPEMELFDAGSTVTLTAVPEEGWVFRGWSGDSGGQECTTATVMDGEKSVTATFARAAQPSNPPAVFVPPNPQVSVHLTGFKPGSSLIVDTTGVVKEDICLETADNVAALEIRQGTEIRDAGGTPLRSLSAEHLTTTLPPPEGSSILSCFRLGPEGSHFSSPVMLTFRYDPIKLAGPEGMRSLYLAYHDGEEWIKLESQVNIMKRTVSAGISHFSDYALLEMLPPPPAKFQTKSLVISGLEVEAGSPVDIRVTVTNTGGRPGTYLISLRINHQEEDQCYAILQPGESKEVVFTVKKEEAGEYLVEVNGLNGHFRVNSVAAPAETTTEPGPFTAGEIQEPDLTARTKEAAGNPENVPTRKMMVSLIWVIAGTAVILILLITILTGSRHKRRKSSFPPEGTER